MHKPVSLKQPLDKSRHKTIIGGLQEQGKTQTFKTKSLYHPKKSLSKLGIPEGKLQKTLLSDALGAFGFLLWLLGGFDLSCCLV